MLALVLKQSVESKVNKSSDENDYAEYIGVFKTLVSDDDNLSEALKRITGLISFVEGIFRAPQVAQVFLYFCLKGAGTSFSIQNELQIPEPSVYRALKRLSVMNVIEKSIRMKKPRYSRGGPRPVVWALAGSSVQDIAAAIRLHKNMLSPKYRLAEEVGQTILADYVDKRNVTEITYREIIVLVKEMKGMPYRSSDVAELTADYLILRGIKVWR